MTTSDALVETTYRVYKYLEYNGEWMPWTPQMDDEAYAVEQLNAIRESQPGEFRLAKFAATREWVDGAK